MWLALTPRKKPYQRAASRHATRRNATPHHLMALTNTSATPGYACRPCPAGPAGSAPRVVRRGAGVALAWPWRGRAGPCQPAPDYASRIHGSLIRHSTLHELAGRARGRAWPHVGERTGRGRCSLCGAVVPVRRAPRPVQPMASEGCCHCVMCPSPSFPPAAGSRSPPSGNRVIATRRSAQIKGRG